MQYICLVNVDKFSNWISLYTSHNEVNDVHNINTIYKVHLYDIFYSFNKFWFSRPFLTRYVVPIHAKFIPHTSHDQRNKSKSTNRPEKEHKHTPLAIQYEIMNFNAHIDRNARIYSKKPPTPFHYNKTKSEKNSLQKQNTMFSLTFLRF